MIPVLGRSVSPASACGLLEQYSLTYGLYNGVSVGKFGGNCISQSEVIFIDWGQSGPNIYSVRD